MAVEVRDRCHGKCMPCSGPMEAILCSQDRLIRRREAVCVWYNLELAEAVPHSLPHTPHALIALCNLTSLTFFIRQAVSFTVSLDIATRHLGAGFPMPPACTTTWMCKEAHNVDVPVPQAWCLLRFSCVCHRLAVCSRAEQHLAREPPGTHAHGSPSNVAAVQVHPCASVVT